MNKATTLSKMWLPGIKKRCWGEGILQIHITTACDKSCYNCTQASNLTRKLVMMTVSEFEIAVKSLENYFGIVGIFGGNPCMHPNFEEICNILCQYIPFERRGLWANKLFGHGETVRKTFNPSVSNINVHNDNEAYSEITKDWPEVVPYIKGLENDSRHTPAYVALNDIVYDESERWKLISECDVNKHWSAMICKIPDLGVNGYFCEIAASQAMLHHTDDSWPNLGLKVDKDWWKGDIDVFEKQIEYYCHRCGIPMRNFGQLAINGDCEEVSSTHLPVYFPKDKNRRINVIDKHNISEKRLNLMIDYIKNSSL